MERQDQGLAFMMQYENVAWYDAGQVRILDRRVYPRKVEFVTCRSHQEVAQALRDMVTQSTGPFTAAAMGMALAAWECRNCTAQQQLAYLEQAADTISHARPTTVGRMQRITGGCLAYARKALAEGVENLADGIRDYTVETNNIRYSKVGRMAGYLVDMFPDNGTVMTQCFAETILAMMLKECRDRGKKIRLFCPETRPFFQGARLTATVCHDMGFDVTVITDNMPACVMQREKVDVFTCAADAICCDGYIANKVGTFQIAIAAKYMGIPTFISGIPDSGHPTVDSVKIELRNPAETLEAMGVKTAKDGVKGYYPAFHITPPSLISGIVTDLGIYSPYDLKRYLACSQLGPYEMVI